MAQAVASKRTNGMKNIWLVLLEELDSSLVKCEIEQTDN